MITLQKRRDGERERMQVKFQHDSHPTLHFLSALLMNNDVETGLLNKMQKTTIILSWRMELLRTYNLLWSNLTQWGILNQKYAKAYWKFQVQRRPKIGSSTKGLIIQQTNTAAKKCASAMSFFASFQFKMSQCATRARQGYHHHHRNHYHRLQLHNNNLAIQKQPYKNRGREYYDTRYSD